MVRKVCASALLSSIFLSGCSTTPLPSANAPITATTSSAAIKHLVVIFGENISYDHYFGSYPNALNNPGETAFTAATGTTTPNNYIKSPGLLTSNPNLASNNGAGASNPFRLAPAQAVTSDQDHNYGDEQGAYDNLKMDLFPKSVGSADTAYAGNTGAPAIASSTAMTMGYFDGNTVTAMWNYAQHYAMSDNSFSSQFGPSTPGAINLISGQTNGVINPVNPGTGVVSDGGTTGGLTMIGDLDPLGDVCTNGAAQGSMSGKNVGDLLNSAKITWGWFQGGFDLSVTNTNGTTGCNRSTISTILTKAGVTAAPIDYVQHHEPFQFYASTQNLQHLRPTSVANIGSTDQANHQYDVHDFTDALAAGNMPSVSFIKAPKYQNAHAANSNPLDEQTFVVNIINAIEKSSFWSSTAIILAYDDSDGWYDHANALVNGSATAQDKLTSAGICVSSTAAAAALKDVTGTYAAQGRCGYGTRQPLIVISPWAKKNYLDSTLTDQSSVLRFIEDTFLSSQRIGGGSYDSIAGTINNMFDFSNSASAPNPNVVTLDPTKGTVTSGN